MGGELQKKLTADELAEFERVASFDWDSVGGDLSDYPVELPHQVRRLVTIPSEECLGKKCKWFGAGCHPRQARKSFGAADVIVTNYHLYFLDLEMKRRGARGVLPEHRLLVCDEAHEMASIARSFMGHRVTRGGIKTAAEDLKASGRRAERLELPRNLDPELKADLERESTEFFGQVDELVRSPRYRARLNKPAMLDGTALEAALKRAAEVYQKAAESDQLESSAREWLRQRSALCARHAGVIRGARELKKDGNIYYLDEQKQWTALVCEPLWPSEILRAALFESEEAPHGIVCCSATLSTGDDRGMAYAAQQVGADHYTALEVESPFDFSRCEFVVPARLPDPNDQTFPGVVGEVMLETIRAAGGRTLGLFTSYRVLDLVHRRLISERLPYRILRQGEAPRTTLVKQFKADPTSILLGTDSFWQGVDVPGDALLAVVIDKIPFAHMDDPVIDAIKAQDPEWFRNHYMPAALIQFKQGFGRLIRSVDDYGAVVCCDRRITSKPYGRNFRKSAPRAVRFGEDLAAVGRVIAEHRAAP
jgi:ATP-dependent DNA helicase DinG